MSKTNKYLKIKASNGSQYSVPLFTSLADLKNNNGHKIQVGGQTLYFPIGSTTDPERTPARIKKSNGTTYAILNTGTPPYTQTLLTVPSGTAGKGNTTGTFTVPAGVTRLRIALCPACIRKDYHWETDGEHDQLVDDYYKGTDTTFGNLSAQKNGTNQFEFGCKKSFTFSPRTSGTATSTDYYSVPSYTYRYTHYASNFSHADEYNKYYTGYIDVQPNQKISYSIGGASGQSNNPSSCGFIFIAYGVGIEK